MSILNKMIYALGFGQPEIDDEQEETSQVSAQAPHRPRAIAETAQIEIDPDVREKIFSQVLDVFNASMPDFLSRSVDPKKQSHLLYEALDKGLQEYIASLEEAAHAKVDAEWQKEREKMTAEAAALKKKAADLEERRAQIHERQLSADRQKRALSERVRDLEEQVLKLEAEKEQYEIETKSMANKTRAVQVLEEEIADLQRQLQEKNPTPAEDPKAKEQIEQLAAELEAAKAAADEANAKLQAAEETLADAKSEAARMKQAFEVEKELVAKAKEETAGVRKELEDALKQAQEAIEEKEALEANPVLDDDTMKEINEIKEQVARFEQVKNKMDARIEKLKNSLKASQKEAESLRMTLRNSLKEHTEQQRVLRDEITRLKANGAVPEIISVEEKTVATDEVDDLVLGTDWLVATPPKDISMRPDPETSDFGYQTPAKKPRTPEFDAQPSLFD